MSTECLEQAPVTQFATGTLAEQRSAFKEWLRGQHLELPALSEAEWRSWASGLRETGHRLQYKMGQWMLYGEAQFGYSAVKSGAIIGISPRHARECMARARVAVLICHEHPEFRSIPYAAFDIIKPRSIPWSEKITLLRGFVEEAMDCRRFDMHVRKWMAENGALLIPEGQTGLKQYRRDVRVPIRFDPKVYEHLRQIAKHEGFRSIEAYLQSHVERVWGEIHHEIEQSPAEEVCVVRREKE